VFPIEVGTLLSVFQEKNRRENFTFLVTGKFHVFPIEVGTLFIDNLMNKPRKGMKSRWSMKRKRKINCSHPRGFSQKNYCNRQKRGGEYLEGFKEWLKINEMQAPPLPPAPPRLYSAPKIAPPVKKTILPTVSQQQNPVSVQNITGWKQGGWKIHLRTGNDDKVRDRAYQIVLNLVAKNKYKWGHKKLHGGVADEKDITIYCGPRGEANLAAKEISSDKELMSLLLPASGDTLGDDIELIPGTNIYGRFDVNVLKTSPYEFTQYGCRGWPMLVHDINAKNASNMSGKNNFDMRSACDKAYKILNKLFGKDFTG